MHNPEGYGELRELWRRDMHNPEEYGESRELWRIS